VCINASDKVNGVVDGNASESGDGAEKYDASAIRDGDVSKVASDENGGAENDSA